MKLTDILKTAGKLALVPVAAGLFYFSDINIERKPSNNQINKVGIELKLNQASAADYVKDPEVIATINGVQSPSRMCFDNAGNLYVANGSGSDIITIIDTDANIVIDKIPGDLYDAGTPLFNKDNSKLFLAGGYGMLVLDPKNNFSILHEFTEGGLMIGLSKDDKTLYDPDSLNNNVNLIDTTTYQIKKTLTGFNAPCKVIENPLKEEFYVTDSANYKVKVFDTLTYSLEKEISFGKGEVGRMDISSTGKLLYPVARSPPVDIIYKVDLDSYTITSQISLGDLRTADIKISPDDERLYVTEPNTDTISIWDASTLGLIKRLNVGDGSNGLAINQKGTRVYVSNYYSNNISVIDTGLEDVVQCYKWSDVISKYNDYVSGNATWSDVISTYNNYVTEPCK